MTILLPIVASVFVSVQNPRYFEEDGKTWIPVGCNICFDRLYGTEGNDRAACEERYFGRMRKFAANGGNFIRIWLGHPFFEVMPERPGEYDAEASETVRKVVKLAEELGVRIKFTLESFGAKTTIIWCRDKECTWRTELEQGIPPGEIRDVVLPFESTSGFKVYLPWEDREVILSAGKCRLPPFIRSCVIRFTDGSSAYLGIQRDI